MLHEFPVRQSELSAYFSDSAHAISITPSEGQGFLSKSTANYVTALGWIFRLSLFGNSWGFSLNPQKLDCLQSQQQPRLALPFPHGTSQPLQDCCRA